jgi:hypothetical protein
MYICAAIGLVTVYTIDVSMWCVYRTSYRLYHRCERVVCIYAVDNALPIELVMSYTISMSNGVVYIFICALIELGIVYTTGVRIVWSIYMGTYRNCHCLYLWCDHGVCICAPIDVVINYTSGVIMVYIYMRTY